ncbi:hypothetical protein [Acinetobacter baumannii]
MDKIKNNFFFWLLFFFYLCTWASYLKALKALNVLALEYALNPPEELKIKNLKMMVYILFHSSIPLTMNFFTSENMGFSFEGLVDCLINITMSYIEDDRNKVA